MFKRQLVLLLRYSETQNDKSPLRNLQNGKSYKYGFNTKMPARKQSNAKINRVAAKENALQEKIILVNAIVEEQESKSALPNSTPDEFWQPTEEDQRFLSEEKETEKYLPLTKDETKVFRDIANKLDCIYDIIPEDIHMCFSASFD